MEEGARHTSTLWPARRSAIAAESPPMPAPTISTVRGGPDSSGIGSWVGVGYWAEVWGKKNMRGFDLEVC